MPGWGDEAADALRRLFKAADEGVDIEDVLYPEDAPRSAEDLFGMLYRPQQPQYTPEQEALFRAAQERQRQYAAEIARKREFEMLDQDLEDAARDEEFLIRLRQMGFDV